VSIQIHGNVPSRLAVESPLMAAAQTIIVYAAL
jgi:hypothetical protein